MGKGMKKFGRKVREKGGYRGGGGELVDVKRDLDLCVKDSCDVGDVLEELDGSGGVWGLGKEEG